MHCHPLLFALYCLCMLNRLFFFYAIVINLLTFLVCGADKRAARRGSWRIPERSLFLLSILGGSPGMLLGMQIFRHKTKHAKFVWGIPLILLAQVLLIAGVYSLFSH